MDVFEKIKQEGELMLDWILPTKKEIQELESFLNITYPEAYVDYLLNYSNINFGFYEFLRMSDDMPWLYARKVIPEAWSIDGLPKNLVPFISDNGDYYCFDINNSEKDFPVRFWSHNGTTKEKWNNFLDWAEKCWLSEYLNPDKSFFGNLDS